MSLFLFCKYVHLYHILCKWYHIIFVFVWLTSLSMKISSCIHVAANGIISFLFLKYLCIYFYLHRVLVVACRLLSSCAVQAPECVGSVVAAHGLSCPMAGRILVARPGIERASPALEGGFLTTGPPGKSLILFLWLNSIPVYIHHIFFIHSSVDGHLGCFHVLATVYSAAMNVFK